MPDINFVSTDLSLPLFMLTRNPLKETRPEKLRDHIHKTSRFYTRYCNLENATMTATKERDIHITGFDKPIYVPRPMPRTLKLTRDLTKYRSWQLPPNRYKLTGELYASRKGEGGAHWAKSHKNKSIVRPERISPKFYELPRESERMWKKCNKYKGPFITNARSHRPTERCLVSNVVTCYRNPNDPGPANYYPKAHELKYNVFKKVVTPKLNPHEFYQRSCVPRKPDSLIPKHISFNPAPGRYEVRYPRVCACSAKKIFCPGLQLLIDREKRLKFRRQPYKKIKARLYCNPDWRHVEGNGHRRLFKMRKKKDAKIKRVKEAKKSDKQIQLYPDGKYISLITQPKRAAFSIRKGRMHTIMPRVIFNCVAKRIMRKQLRNNKKIAFLSGKERFTDIIRSPPLTVKQMEEAKERLPIDRQLRDYPVMEIPISDIKSRIEHTPKHMMAFYELELRKPLFKFHPLPEPKLLVTEKVMRGESVDGKYVPPNFYAKPIIRENFFKS